MYMETRAEIRALKIAGTERSRPCILRASITIRAIKNVPQNVTVADNSSSIKFDEKSPFFKALSSLLSPFCSLSTLRLVLGGDPPPEH